jgi:DNA-directed RNA polymerase specialized sigma subunit
MDQDPEKYWQEWKKKPTPENLLNTVKAFDGLINTSIGQQKSINPTLLRSRAKILVSQAVKTYSPSEGTRLSTHVYNYLRPLNRDAKNMTEISPLSRHFSEETGKYINFINEFSQENGREPDDSEIMDNLGISKGKLNKLNQSVKYEIPESQLVGGVELDEDEESNRLNLWTDYVYNDLDSFGKKILDYKLGRNGNPVMSNDDIAIKLKISPSEVSIRSAKIAEKILNGVNSREKIIQ